MKFMKALLVTGIGKLSLSELPVPQIGPYEALVKVEACGICNSTDHKILEGLFVSGLYPTALGHESVGVIVETGAKVRNYRLGQRVLRPGLQDRHVPGGRSTWGGFTEYGVVTDLAMMRADGVTEGAHWSGVKQQIVPEEITPPQAAAMITLKETLSTLHNFEVGHGTCLAVVGTGPVAQAFVFEAKLLGANPVVVFGRREDWRERFARLGADEYVVGEERPAGVARIIHEGGFERVLEAVGSRAALSKALGLAGANGKVGLYGVTPESEDWNPTEKSDPRVTVPRVEEADVHEEMLEWVASGEIRLDDWYSAVLPWTEYARGFEMVAENHAAKVILSMV